MRKIKKHQKTGGKRLTRRALWLVLAVVLALGASAGVLAAESAGLIHIFSEEEADAGYSVSTKTGLTQNGENVDVARNDDEDPDWQQDSEKENTYYLYLADAKEGDEPIVTLVMDGNVWTYQFSVIGNELAEYYVTEFINRENAEDYTATDAEGEELPKLTVGDYYIVVTGTDGTVKFYNSTGEATLPDYGSLTISKTVVDSDGKEVTDSTRFQFEITLTYTPTSDSDITASLLTGWQTYGSVDVQWTVDEAEYTGVGSVWLSAGESVTLTNIPAGVAYTVSEAETDGYTTSWTGDTGTIGKDETATAACTNKKNPEPEPGTEPEPTGSVRVAKLVTAGGEPVATDDTNETTEFSMKLSLSGLTVGKTYSYTVYDTGYDDDGNKTETSAYSDTYTVQTADGSADVSFKLTNGQYAEFKELPVGSKYQVTEFGVEDYTPSYRLSGGGDDHEYALSGDQKYDANVDLQTANETLDKAEAEADTPVTVTYTNDKPETPTGDDSISVTVSKQWLNASGEDESTSHNGEEITIHLIQSSVSLTDDKLSYEEPMASVVLNGTDDSWTWTWENLERYTDGGEPYYYYIREEAPDGYSSTVSLEKEPSYEDKDNKTTQGDYEFTVTNSTSVELPYTGGSGTAPLVTVGLLLMAGAVVCLSAVRRRRGRGEQ